MIRRSVVRCDHTNAYYHSNGLKYIITFTTYNTNPTEIITIIKPTPTSTKAIEQFIPSHF